MFVIEVRISDGSWLALCNSYGVPYVFTTKEDAWGMANICYPDSLRNMRLDGEKTVRVVEVNK